jgi:hypothetical protein
MQMTEIKETLRILKARWPEVSFIIGLYVLSLFGNKLHLIDLTKPTMPKLMLSHGYLLLLFVINVVAILLTVGFQRTIYLEDRKRHTPLNLLRIGKHFFWRVVGFGLIYVPIFFILAWLTSIVIKRLTTLETSFWGTFEVAPLAYQLCFATATLILIKPLLLTFPMIVVLDCRLFEAFKLLKQCKLRYARELVILYFISIGVSFLWLFMTNIKSATTFSEFLLIVGRSILQLFIGLMMAVMGVRFVASLDLVYYGSAKDLNSEDLLRSPTED